MRGGRPPCPSLPELDCCWLLILGAAPIGLLHDRNERTMNDARSSVLGHKRSMSLSSVAASVRPCLTQTAACCSFVLPLLPLFLLLHEHHERKIKV